MVEWKSIICAKSALPIIYSVREDEIKSVFHDFLRVSVARNCPVPVTILDIKIELLCNEWTLEICIKNDSYFINILTKDSLK